MIYEALRDAVGVAEDGSLREIVAGKWYRTPGPAEELVELFGEDLIRVDERQEGNDGTYETQD